jgi:hypothetical protein
VSLCVLQKAASEAFMKEQIEESFAKALLYKIKKIGAIDFNKELQLLGLSGNISGPDQIEIRVDANGF